MLAYPWLRAGLAAGLLGCYLSQLSSELHWLLAGELIAYAWAGADVLSRLWLHVLPAAMLVRWELSFALCWCGRWIGESCWHRFDAIFSQSLKFWNQFCD